MAIQLNPAFKELYTTNKRYILITGGRGSSKSYNLATFLCLLTYEQQQRILFTRYTLTAAESSIIPEFRGKIDALEVPHHFNINTHNVTNTQTKSIIIFSGIKASSGIQTAKLKGIDATTWINDESEEFREESVFEDIDLSIRNKSVQNRIGFILNPTDTDHWIYRRWIEKTNRIEYFDGIPVEISTHPDVLHIHTTYLNNIKYLNESFLNTINDIKLNNPKIYAHKIIGQWTGVAEGAIFNKNEIKTYKTSELLTKEFESSLAYIDVADEGTDFTVCVVGRNIGSKCYITDIYCSDENTDVTTPNCAVTLKQQSATYCRIESNSFGAMFGRNIAKLQPATKILPATSTTHKHTRIIMEMPHIMEYFVFKHESERSPMYTKAMNQLFNYTKDGKAKHDDVADAMSGLSIFTRAMLKKYYV